MNTLLDHPVSHRNDNIHSIKAGEKHHKTGKAEANRLLILNKLILCLATCPERAMTHREIAKISGIDYHEVSRRSSELGRSGRCERITDDEAIRLWVKL